MCYNRNTKKVNYTLKLKEKIMRELISKETIEKEIQKNLPGVTASWLKDYMTKSDAIEKVLDETQNKHELLLKENMVLKSLKLDAEKIIQDQYKIELALKTFEKEKTEFEKTKAVNEVKLICSTEKTAVVIEMFTTVFRNTETRKKYLGDMPIREKFADGSEYTHKENIVIDETERAE